MKTTFIKLLLTIVALICIIGQISAQDLNLGSYSDSFHIRHNYVSGEAVTITIDSPMHVTMHTYSTDLPLRPVDGSTVDAQDDAVTTISVRDASTGRLIAQQSGSLYRKFVFDVNQACLTLPVLPAGTYSVTVEGDESTLLTMEGFLTDPPHSLDGREAGQPVDLGAFSTEFGYSRICDTSGEGYWAGYGSPSNDVYYKFTLDEFMYVVVTHWGTEMMSDIVPSRLSVLICDRDGTLQDPPLAEVYDMACEDNLMGNENIVNLLISPDQLPEIEYNDPLCASWHGMLRPGTYYVVSEGPYRSTNYSQAFNGPIRTNIRGFIYPTEETRGVIHVGNSEDGVLEFSDSKFFGMISDDSITYNFTLDTTADVTVITDADNLILEKSDSILYNLSNPGTKSWEELPAGEYTLSLTATENRIINIRISSKKYVAPPDTPSDIPSDDPSVVPEKLDKKNNFIRALRPFREGTADPDRIDLGNSRQTIEYYDGLGRPVQTVRRRESPSGEDLANYVRYDYGRLSEEWNETVVGCEKAFIPYATLADSARLVYGDTKPYKKTEYESDLLSRTKSQTSSGEAWHNAEKDVRYEYYINDTTGVLSCLHFIPSSDYSAASIPTLSGIYPMGTLSVVKTTSEDGVETYQFTDSYGHNILSRVVTEDGCNDTYYVYDVRCLLRAVITPAAVSLIDSTGNLSTSDFADYCYSYGYDDRGRCVCSSRPGVGTTVNIYAPDDHLVFVQTPQLAVEGKWKFDIQDVFGRTAITGLCSGTYDSLKSLADDDIRAVFGDGPASSGFWETIYPLDSMELHLASFYDDYSFLAKFGERASDLEYMPDSVTNARREDVDETLTCWGLSTGCLMTTGAEGISDVLSVSYYDVYGNVIQTRSENLLGGVSSVSREYDFQGQCMSEEEKHIYNEDNVNTISRTHKYDRAGRLIETITNLDGVEVATKNTYDPIGRLEMTVVTNGEVSDTTMHTYNVRGWQTSIENDHWSAVMRYNNPIHSDSIASFTGNISEWEWSRGNETNAYSLSYDDLSRITGSRLFRNGTPSNALSEIGISYDSNGNILSLKRTGEDGSAVNDLNYRYDGNRLASLSDSGIQSQNYTYDADGNMTFDGRTGMSLTWNDLGLVEKVSLNDTDLVNYSYLADGTKVSALDGDGDGLLYLGSLIYRKTGSNISLESAGFAGGRFVARETLPGVSSMVPMFHVTDHLGSVRAVVDGVSGAVVETNDYYPFGSRWNTAANLTANTNRFRYNSKEEQSSLYPESVRNAVSYIDYGARQYDPAIGRWFAQDPLSEKYYGISPYAFCAGNPVKYLDPNGEDPTLPARMAGGAIIGGAISGTAAIIKGKSFTEVVAATAGGAVDGAIGATGFGVGGKFFSGLVGGGLGNLVEQELNKAFGNQKGKIDGSNIVVSAALGAGMNGASEAIEQSGKSLIKYLINSDATQKALEKEVKQSVKSAGRKTTPSSIKKAVDDKINEMIEAADKTLETFLQALGYSFGFYNEVLTDE